MAMDFWGEFRRRKKSGMGGIGMNSYEQEELLPIVAELSEKYTSKESTSVTYEIARQLMEAVIYCISACEKSCEDQQLLFAKLTARQAYETGYEKVVGKVKKAKQKYNKMITGFQAYGNENYHDTVTKAIPGFFLYYDVRFAPQETIITMDYPIIGWLDGATGIDAIEKYVDCISLEQQFLRMLPNDYIFSVLTTFQADYRKQFYNICLIVLKHILGCMLIEKRLDRAAVEEDYERLQSFVTMRSLEELTEKLTFLLEKLIQEKYHDDQQMQQYLSGGLDDFSVELWNAAEYNQISKAVVL
jgi:hypothetical protein